MKKVTNKSSKYTAGQCVPPDRVNKPKKRPVDNEVLKVLKSIKRSVHNLKHTWQHEVRGTDKGSWLRAMWKIEQMLDKRIAKENKVSKSK